MAQWSGCSRHPVSNGGAAGRALFSWCSPDHAQETCATGHLDLRVFAVSYLRVFAVS